MYYCFLLHTWIVSISCFQPYWIKEKKTTNCFYFGFPREWDLWSYSAFLSVILLITFESIGWCQPPLTQGSHLSDITFPHILCKSRSVSRRKALLDIYPSHRSAATQPSQQVGVGRAPGWLSHLAVTWETWKCGSRVDVAKSGIVGRGEG